MKLSVLVLSVAVLALLASSALAGPTKSGGKGLQLGGPQSGPGDCTYNPDAPDDDGDGIPNGQDPDYIPPVDGSGSQYGQAISQGPLAWLQNWWRHGVLGSLGLTPTNVGYGPGDGTGNDGDGPQDGTGYGPGSVDDTCDGDGPMGFIFRNKK